MVTIIESCLNQIPKVPPIEPCYIGCRFCLDLKYRLAESFACSDYLVFRELAIVCNPVAEDTEEVILSAEAMLIKVMSFLCAFILSLT